ncbi:hypothetical protein KBT16_18460 [Nostoc sp. CCCryo 231-06]|nr:hypothetical protein [Nostoc sp. CCCryo 231-06]
MEIQLNESELQTVTQNWNILLKSKNYCIPTSIEEYSKFDTYSVELEINSRAWILLENATKALNEVVDKIHASPSLKNIVSSRTVYTIVKKELKIEIAAREQNSISKRDFSEVLESIKQAINDKISHSDFFFIVEGLEFKDIEIIRCGKVEIFIFNQELRNQLIAISLRNADEQDLESRRHTQKFFDENFLSRICIKSIAYGDSDVANKQAYKQAREVINYFRYVLCLFTHKRVSDQMVKVNLLSEAYGNSERYLIKREKDNTVILVSGRGRRPLQKFPIDKDRLQDLLFNGFLEDFITIINTSPKTQVEGCILTAIYWIGEAQNESDLDVAFLKYWTALECIFTGSEQPTHSLAKGVATINAFSGYEFIKIEDAKEVYKNIKKLYEKRSHIIHRGMNYLADQVINEADVSKICKYTAWSILSLFHLRSIGYIQRFRLLCNTVFL